MDRFVQDLRYGVRALRARPGFTLVAVLTLALGIAVNTTMFSVVSGVLLSDLPYRDPERLALIRVMSDGQTSLPSVSPPEVEDLRERAGVYEDVASIRDNTGTLTGAGEPNSLSIAARTPHPHAAILFADWILSQEGQTKLAEIPRLSIRKGIKQRGSLQDLFVKDFTFVNPASYGANTKQIIDKFNQIFGIR